VSAVGETQGEAVWGPRVGKRKICLSGGKNPRKTWPDTGKSKATPLIEIQNGMVQGKLLLIISGKSIEG